MRGSIVALGLALFACSDADRAAADTEVAAGSGEPTFTGGDGSEATSVGHATSVDDGTATAEGDDSTSADPPSGPPTRASKRRSRSIRSPRRCRSASWMPPTIRPPTSTSWSMATRR